MLLKGFLRIHHDPRESGERAFEPLTAEQIAEKMGWVSESGTPLQSKVSRRMTQVFGKDAMKKYRQLLQGDLRQGFVKTLDDGSRDVEGIDDREDELDLD